MKQLLLLMVLLNASCSYAAVEPLTVDRSVITGTDYKKDPEVLVSGVNMITIDKDAYKSVLKENAMYKSHIEDQQRLMDELLLRMIDSSKMIDEIKAEVFGENDVISTYAME